MKNKGIALVLVALLVIGVLATGVAAYFLPAKEEVAYNQVKTEIEIESNLLPLSGEAEVEDTDTRHLMLIDFQGLVTVGVALINLDDHPADHLEFEVALNTHSWDLDQYDLAAMSHLSLDGIPYPVENIEWRITEGEGHHLKGRLTMVGRGLDTDILEVAQSMELDILGLGGADSRLFRWELPELLSAREGASHDS